MDCFGTVLGAAGWSEAAPVADGTKASQQAAVGHVRHVATDPGAVRRGIGAAIMGQVLRDARAKGVRRLECLSTRTAVAFYAAQGFTVVVPEVEVPLGPDILFPSVSMLRQV